MLILKCHRLESVLAVFHSFVLFCFMVKMTKLSIFLIARSPPLMGWLCPTVKYLHRWENPTICWFTKANFPIKFRYRQHYLLGLWRQSLKKTNKQTTKNIYIKGHVNELFPCPFNVRARQCFLYLDCKLIDVSLHGISTKTVLGLRPIAKVRTEPAHNKIKRAQSWRPPQCQLSCCSSAAPHSVNECEWLWLAVPGNTWISKTSQN